MTTIALPPLAQLNWPRVSAWSGTLSLHAIAIALLLVPPVAMTLLHPPRSEVVEARLIAPPPANIEEPRLPLPARIVREVRPIRPPVTQAPVAPPIVESPLPAQHVDPVAGPTPAAAHDVAPTALAYHTRTRIAYPREAAQRHQQGTVILRVLVGVDGLPEQVEIEKSSGWRSLDDAARDAVRRWTFQAGTHNGIPTALWARVPIAFSMESL